MGCNSDYMEANQLEINLSTVYRLLDELKTGKLSPKFGDGYDKRVYDKGLPQKHLDKKTKELCSKLQSIDVTKYSLEMQLWWRKHQEADKERVQMQIEKHKDNEAKKIALSKLSDYERKLLGL